MPARDLLMGSMRLKAELITLRQLLQADFGARCHAVAGEHQQQQPHSEERSPPLRSKLIADTPQQQPRRALSELSGNAAIQKTTTSSLFEAALLQRVANMAAAQKPQHRPPRPPAAAGSSGDGSVRTGQHASTKEQQGRPEALSQQAERVLHNSVRSRELSGLGIGSGSTGLNGAYWSLLSSQAQ